LRAKSAYSKATYLDRAEGEQRRYDLDSSLLDGRCLMLDCWRAMLSMLTRVVIGTVECSDLAGLTPLARNKSQYHGRDLKVAARRQTGRIRQARGIALAFVVLCLALPDLVTEAWGQPDVDPKKIALTPGDLAEGFQINEKSTGYRERGDGVVEYHVVLDGPKPERGVAPMVRQTIYRAPSLASAQELFAERRDTSVSALIPAVPDSDELFARVRKESRLSDPLTMVLELLVVGVHVDTVVIETELFERWTIGEPRTAITVPESEVQAALRLTKISVDRSRALRGEEAIPASAEGSGGQGESETIPPLKLAGDPPQPGAVVLSDPLNAPGVVPGSTGCNDGRNTATFVDEGYLVKVTAPCVPGQSPPNLAAGPLPGVDLPDGELALDFKGVSGQERAFVTLWLRARSAEGGCIEGYGINVFPAAGVAALTKKHGCDPVVSLAVNLTLQGRIAVNDWNTVAIRLSGPEIWVLVNEEAVLSASDDDFSRGGVLFGAGRRGAATDTTESAVVFRNLRLAVLAPSMDGVGD
jgi:hypothetical protein